jgi:hypothetical protein
MRGAAVAFCTIGGALVWLNESFLLPTLLHHSEWIITMPRRRNQEPERPTTPPGGWRYLDAEDPEAWPQLVAFDLECV